MSLPRRTFSQRSSTSSWEEIWDAGPYYNRISELLEGAENFAAIVGWQIDSRLSLPVPGTTKHEPLKTKLIRLVEARPELHIYVLMWAHAYFYILEREHWQTRVWDQVHPRIHFVFDSRHPLGGAHHEKLCLIDGRVALCGGIDICDDRWDSPSHLYWDPRRSLNGSTERHGPYHDMAVQVSGEICQEIHSHIATRWEQLSSVPFPTLPDGPVPQDSCRPIYLSRTVGPIDAGARLSPLVRDVEFLFRELIFSARDRLLLEGQYYWSQEVNDMLIAKMLKESHRKREKPFEIILILAHLENIRSWTRHMTAYELKLLRRLEEAAAYTGTCLTLASPWSKNAGATAARPIYIHSKLILSDDRYMTLGSANLATRALRLDTEVNLTLEAARSADRAHLRRVGREVLRHWSPHQLRPIHPLLAYRHLGNSAGMLKQFKWNRFFDPRLPWLYPMKRSFRRMTRHYPHLLSGLAVALWIILALIAWTGSGFPWSQTMLYAIILTGVWLLPIPFLPVAIIAALALGGRAATPLILWSYWLSALTAYGLTRTFPALFPSRLRDPRLGSRTFEGLITFLFDPRIPMRIKLQEQGITCVPLPWFALCNGLLIPAAIYMICRWLPQVTLAVWPIGSLTLTLAAVGVSIIRGIHRGEDHDETEATQGPQLQYPQRLQHEQPPVHPAEDPRSDSARPSRPGIPARSSWPTRRTSSKGGGLAR